MTNPTNPKNAFVEIARPEYEKLISDLTEANQRAVLAEQRAVLAEQRAVLAERMTADERAELRAREASAAAGFVLPAKIIGAGNHTVTQKETSSGATPRQRLAEGFSVQQ